MFVHVEGPNQAFANGDHQPARPFEWWRAGQFIRYTTTVDDPAHRRAGHVHACGPGLFDAAATRARPRARGARPRSSTTRSTVATIEVAP